MNHLECFVVHIDWLIWMFDEDEIKSGNSGPFCISLVPLLGSEEQWICNPLITLTMIFIRLPSFLKTGMVKLFFVDGTLFCGFGSSLVLALLAVWKTISRPCWKTKWGWQWSRLLLWKLQLSVFPVWRDLNVWSSSMVTRIRSVSILETCMLLQSLMRSPCGRTDASVVVSIISLPFASTESTSISMTPNLLPSTLWTLLMLLIISLLPSRKSTTVSMSCSLGAVGQTHVTHWMTCWTLVRTIPRCPRLNALLMTICFMLLLLFCGNSIITLPHKGWHHPTQHQIHEVPIAQLECQHWASSLCVGLTFCSICIWSAVHLHGWHVLDGIVCSSSWSNGCGQWWHTQWQWCVSLPSAAIRATL
jgi:hypothetical protein